MSAKWEPFKPTTLRRLLPEKVVNRLKELLVFNQIDNQQQSPPATNNDPDVTIPGFRNPAPGSQPKVSIPTGIDAYNSNFYIRDTLKYKEPTIEGFHASLNRLPEQEEPELGSPGNKNPAVLAYDPTGTRSAMTTTHAATKELLKGNLPNHLPHFEWEKRESEIIALFEKRGLPPVPGAPSEWDTPDGYKTYKW